MGVLSPTLAVRNMKETIEFYKSSLGFKMGQQCLSYEAHYGYV